MNLAHLAKATHIEITLALGARMVVSREIYLALTDDQLAGSVARALSRKQVIALRARARVS